VKGIKAIDNVNFKVDFQARRKANKCSRIAEAWRHSTSRWGVRL